MPLRCLNSVVARIIALAIVNFECCFSGRFADARPFRSIFVLVRCLTLKEYNHVDGDFNENACRHVTIVAPM